MNDTRIYSPTISLEKLIALRHHAENIQLQSYKKSAATTSGIQHSSFRGRGMDFDEVRIYQAGDDIRNMDWRVTARTGKPHTKLYREERERPVYFILDFNSTMFFGSKVTFKSVIAAQIAGLLTWAASLRGDRIGGLIFNGHQYVELRPQFGKRGTLPILKNISKFLEIESETQSKLKNGSSRTQENNYDLPWALARLRHFVKPGSSIFIISDFPTDSWTVAADVERPVTQWVTQLLTQLTRYNDMAAYFIYDELEAKAPPPNRYTISDGSDASDRSSFYQFDSGNKKFRHRHQQQFSDKMDMLETLFRMQHIPMMTMKTDDDVIDLLKRRYRRAR